MSLKIKATTPCYKFINASPEQQLAKIREEVEEVAQAWEEYSKNKNVDSLQHLLVELLDVKACVNTAILQIHENVNRCNFESLESRNGYLEFYSVEQAAKREVIEKNLRRGYYIEDKGSRA